MSLQYGELRSTSGWDRFVSLGHPSKFQQLSRLGSVTAQYSSSGRQPNFAVFNIGRHVHSAGRPSRCASAHILVLSCFPRLISAVADWISTILPHMVWPYRKFRMQVWNVVRAARWKCRTQKIGKKSPSGHYRTTLSGYIFATYRQSEKNLLSSNISSTGPHNMVNFGPLVYGRPME